MSQQPGTTPLPRLRRAFSVRRMLLTAAGGAAALGVALSGVGGSYALWSSQAEVTAGSITSGSAGLSAAWGAGHNAAGWQNLLPGESHRQAFVVDNTGDVAMALSASVTAAPGFEVRAAAGPCATTPLPGPSLGATPTTVVSGSAPTVLAAGAALTGCVEVRATSSASPAGTTAFTLTIDGRQAP